MALTDDEQKLFESLIGNINPNVVQKVEGKKHRKVILHALLLLVGISVLLYSVYIKQPVVGVSGFAVMVYSVNTLIKLSRFSRND